MSACDAGLVVEAVSHDYGTTPVVRDASLTVGPGEIHSLLGPSGSGKTTLLRLVAGLEVLRQGHIWICGQQVAGPARHVPPESRAIGFVLQDYALFPHLNVRDNVLFGMPRKTRQQRQARVEQLLDNVGMIDFARAMPHTLSGGQQQRVALARALAREPVIMLLDEPFSGLDARLRGEIREITLRVLRAARVATLLVTHDPQEAMLVSDVVSVLRASRIEQTGTPAELYFQPQTLHVAEVFGNPNSLGATVCNGSVPTPWGSVPAPGQPEGAAVRVLLRPECLLLQRDQRPGALSATVRRQCLRGETASVELDLATGQTLTASVPSHCAWPPGSTVHVSLIPQSPIVLPERASSPAADDRTISNWRRHRSG